MRGAVISLLLGLVGFAQGEISESRDFIVETAQHKIVARLAEYLGWPDRPIDRGLVVVVDAGGGFTSVTAMGPIAADAKPVAGALERFSGGDAVWSQEDDASAARTETRTSKLGQTAGETTVDLPRLRRELERVASPVRIALRVPAYASAVGEGAEVGKGKSWRLSVSPDRPVTVRTTLPQWTAVALVAFFLSIPIVGSGLFLVAIRRARDERLTLEDRRKSYRALVVTGTAGLLTAHSIVAVVVLGSGVLRPVGDLWFGKASLGWAIPFFMAGILPVFALGPLLTSRENKLFGPPAGETPRGEREGLPPKPVVDPVLKAGLEERIKRSARWSTGFFMAGLLLPATAKVIFRKNAEVEIGAMVAMLFFFALSFFSIRVAKRTLAPHREPDADLQRDADELAERLKVKRRMVLVNRDPAVADVAGWGPMRLDDAIVVNERAVRILEPEELRFLLASSLRPSIPKKFWLVAIGTVVAFLAFMLAGFFLLPDHLRRYALASGLLVPLAPSLFIKPLKRWVADADRDVLAVTGDRDAAERALRKLHADSSEEPLPKETEARIAAWG